MFPPVLPSNAWANADLRRAFEFLLRISTKACNADNTTRRAYPRDAVVTTIRTPSPDGHCGSTPPQSPVNSFVRFAAAPRFGISFSKTSGTPGISVSEQKGQKKCISTKQRYSYHCAESFPPVAIPWVNRLLLAGRSAPARQLSPIPTWLKGLQSALVRIFSTASSIPSAATNSEFRTTDRFLPVQSSSVRALACEKRLSDLPALPEKDCLCLPRS